jgi:predicted enzyme related to lactoylglutathione lyase
MGRPVVHFEIAAPDAAGAAEFYKQLFDWEINHEPNMDYWLVNTGQPDFGGGIMKPQGPEQKMVTLYVLVDDLNVYLAKAESLGGKTLVPPMPIPGHGSFAMFADPAGNAIGLYKGQE